MPPPGGGGGGFMSPPGGGGGGFMPPPGGLPAPSPVGLAWHKLLDAQVQRASALQVAADL